MTTKILLLLLLPMSFMKRKFSIVLLLLLEERYRVDRRLALSIDAAGGEMLGRRGIRVEYCYWKGRRRHGGRFALSVASTRRVDAERAIRFEYCCCWRRWVGDSR